MAGGTVNIILLGALSVVAANTCTLNTITWSCPAEPHLTLKFSNVTVKSCNKHYDKELFKEPMGIYYTGDIDQDKTYTVVMVDPDAPKHENGEAWLHWIYTGLTGKDLLDGKRTTGKDIVDYKPPTPPKGTGIHRYFVFVFEETGHVRAENFTRSKFDLMMYAEDHELCGPLASNMFRTEY